MMKKLFLMTVAVFCAIAQDAWADNDPITYIERSWDEVNKRVVETEKTCYSYTLLSGNHSDWQGLYDGWYVVKDANVTYQTLNVLGNAHLILCDGAQISLTGGMKLEGSRTLTIYGQKGGLDGEGSGTLDATNTDYDDAAGIGSAANTTCGNLIVHGGNVRGTGNKNAAGIGGGDGSHSGDITIYGGSVMAQGGDNAAGIGGGEEKGSLTPDPSPSGEGSIYIQDANITSRVTTPLIPEQSSPTRSLSTRRGVGGEARWGEAGGEALFGVSPSLIVVNYLVFLWRFHGKGVHLPH